MLELPLKKNKSGDEAALADIKVVPVNFNKEVFTMSFFIHIDRSRFYYYYIFLYYGCNIPKKKFLPLGLTFFSPICI